MDSQVKKNKAKGKAHSKNITPLETNKHSPTAAAGQRRRSARLAALKHEQRQGEDSSTIRIPVDEAEPQSDLIMRFATPMPSKFVAGRAVPLPVVVLLGHRLGVLPDTNDIWVFVSLVNGDSEGLPQEDLLHGCRADSFHPLLKREGVEDGSFAYASFADLVVSGCSRYRFRMTAIDMKR